MVYPIIIPVSRGHGVSTGSAPLSAKIAISSMVIALMLLLGCMWWKMISDFDSKLEQIILTLIFFLIETGLTCLLVGIF
ncbi:MAG: hypothetical protein UHK60_08995 [Acutalibacteraceae bacterium]|nr:hypothetical protein [Acutalibacteraceae bacterium]